MQEPVVEPPQVDRRLKSGGYGPVSSARPRKIVGDFRVGLGLAGREVTTKACGVVVTRFTSQRVVYRFDPLSVSERR